MRRLDGTGAVADAIAVQSDMAAGCDLVLLNKFGKLEIAGDGLVDAGGDQRRTPAADRQFLLPTNGRAQAVRCTNQCRN